MVVVVVLFFFFFSLLDQDQKDQAGDTQKFSRTFTFLQKTEVADFSIVCGVGGMSDYQTPQKDGDPERMATHVQSLIK